MPPFQPKRKSASGTGLWMYFMVLFVGVSMISMTQIRLAGKLTSFHDGESQMLVPGLKEWRSDALDKFKKAHPRIEDKESVDDDEEEEVDEEGDNPEEEEEEATRDEAENPVSRKAVDQLNNAPQATTTKGQLKPPVRKAKDTITYAIAVTHCPKDNHVMYGAAVLAESIKNMSIRRNPESHYDYNLYAFVHDDARDCNAALYSLGYTVLNGKSPHPNVDKEFIKVYALSLTNHKIVVTLEVDTLVLQPLDELFDLILEREIAPDFAHAMEVIPKQVDFISTGTASKLVDHSFFVARTSQKAYQEMSDRIDIEYKNHEDGASEKTFDDFLNDMYGEEHFELDSCVYNTYMGDDCADTTFDQIQLAHFSSCGAPWDCPHSTEGSVCASLLKEWHRNRKQLDRDLGNDVPNASEGMTDTFGYCADDGSFLPVHIEVVDPENA